MMEDSVEHISQWDRQNALDNLIVGLFDPWLTKQIMCAALKRARKGEFNAVEKRIRAFPQRNRGHNPALPSSILTHITSTLAS